jgi:hypothetical protein
MVGGAGGGEEGAGSGDTPVTATWGDTRTNSSPTVVAASSPVAAAKRLPSTASVTAGAGMLQQTVKI